LEEQAFTEIGERKVLNPQTPELQFFPTGERFYDYIKDYYIYHYICNFFVSSNIR